MRSTSACRGTGIGRAVASSGRFIESRSCCGECGRMDAGCNRWGRLSRAMLSVAGCRCVLCVADWWTSRFRWCFPEPAG